MNWGYYDSNNILKETNNTSPHQLKNKIRKHLDDYLRENEPKI